MELELAKCKMDMMSLNSQLLDAIQQKLNLSQQLEAWQVRAGKEAPEGSERRQRVRRRVWYRRVRCAWVCSSPGSPVEVRVLLPRPREDAWGCSHQLLRWRAQEAYMTERKQSQV